MRGTQHGVELWRGNARRRVAGAQIVVDLVEAIGGVAEEVLQQRRVGLQDVHHHPHQILHAPFALAQFAFEAYLPRNVVGRHQQVRDLARLHDAVEADLQKARLDAAVRPHAGNLDAVERIEAGDELLLDVVAQQQLDVLLGRVVGLGRHQRLEQFKEIVARFDLEPEDALKRFRRLGSHA